MNYSFDKYIGIPYATANCWQLVCKIQAEVFSIVLPLFESVSPADDINIRRTIKVEQKKGCWQKLVRPKHGCLVLMNRSKNPSHIGVYVKAGNVSGVIHTSNATGSIFTLYNQLNNIWNISGFYSPVKQEFNND